jgi:hypothetical protein
LLLGGPFGPAKRDIYFFAYTYLKSNADIRRIIQPEEILYPASAWRIHEDVNVWIRPLDARHDAPQHHWFGRVELRRDSSRRELRQMPILCSP